MLPGKKYTPEDYLRMAWRRRWWILVPAFVTGLGTAVFTYFLPDVYQAESVILIVPQTVPTDYVRPTVTGRLDDRLNRINQQLLTRTRLERIMQETNLYAKERETMIMEDVINLMRANISVNLETGRRGEVTDAFRVSFRASDPRIAVQVTEKLASGFVQENLTDRERSADNTSQFLQAALEDARKKLQESEAKLAEFRRRNAGQLPTQVDSNLQLMSNTQMQLQQLAEAMNRDRDRSLQVDREISALLAQLALPLGDVGSAPPAVGDTAPVVPTAGGGAAQNLEAARQQLALLEKTRTPNHPDVRRAKSIVVELEEKAKAEAEAGVPTDPKPAPTLQAAQMQLAKLRQEFQEIESRMEARRREEARLQGMLSTYRARLEMAPALETELAELMRGYGTLSRTYDDLLRKSEESKIAVNLERRQIGEQFRILDGARLPQRPISPDRVRLNAMGFLVGLGFGLALVALFEYRDTTIKTDSDVSVSLSLPVLAVIPIMQTALDRLRARRRRRLVIGISAVTLVAVVATGIVLWRTGLLYRLVT